MLTLHCLRSSSLFSSSCWAISILTSPRKRLSICWRHFADMNTACSLLVKRIALCRWIRALHSSLSSILDIVVVLLPKQRILPFFCLAAFPRSSSLLLETGCVIVFSRLSGILATHGYNNWHQPAGGEAEFATATWTIRTALVERRTACGDVIAPAENE